MNLRQFILIFLLGTITSGISWLLVTTRIDASTAGIFGFILFYFTFFIFLNGLFSTLAIIYRSYLRHQKDISRIVSTSLRQGLLFSLLLTGSLFLESLGLFAWWSIIILLFSMILIEFLFHSEK